MAKIAMQYLTALGGGNCGNSEKLYRGSIWECKNIKEWQL